jgi:phage FluMu protein Com
MATARFAPCPHCHTALSYLEGVSGSSMNPTCPRCKAVVTVSRATFLMADHSRRTAKAPPAAFKPVS